MNLVCKNTAEIVHLTFTKNLVTDNLSTLRLIMATSKVDIGKYNFSYSAATIWNDTSANVRNSPTLITFKINAKTWVKVNVSL